jgi:hypothetical protein
LNPLNAKKLKKVGFKAYLIALFKMGRPFRQTIGSYPDSCQQLESPGDWGQR